MAAVREAREPNPAATRIPEGGVVQLKGRKGIINDVVKDAVAAAVVNELNKSLSDIVANLTALKSEEHEGRGGHKKAIDLELEINNEARQYGTLVKTFEKHVGAAQANAHLEKLNTTIRNAADDIYGKDKGGQHVTYHNISAVHEVKVPIAEETLSMGEVESILANVEARLGETLTRSLELLGLADNASRDAFEAKLMAIRAARRDVVIKPSSNVDPSTQILHDNVVQLVAGSIVDETKGPGKKPRMVPTDAQKWLAEGKAPPKLLTSGEEPVAKEASGAPYKLVNAGEHIGWEIKKEGAAFELSSIYDPVGVHLGRDRFTQVYFRTQTGQIYMLDENGSLHEKGDSRTGVLNIKLDPNELMGKALTVGQKFDTTKIITSSITEIVPVTAQTHYGESLKDMPKNGIIAEYDDRMRRARQAQGEA